MVRKSSQKDETSTIKLDRGMSEMEVDTLMKSPMGDKERGFFRAIYETTFRANELLQCNIQDYDKKTGELTCLKPKSKYNRRTQSTYQPPPKHCNVSKSTQLLFKRIIGNRKKGAIFVNRRNGNRIAITYFQMYLYDVATRIGIQKTTKITYCMRRPRKQHLVTLQGLREAGERHMDLRGADQNVTARAAQHSAVVKEKYYKKSSWEEFQQQQRKYHPAFQE